MRSENPLYSIVSSPVFLTLDNSDSETVECVVSGEFTMSYLNCLGTVFYAMVLWNAARFNLLAPENASYYRSITCVYKYTWTYMNPLMLHPKNRPSHPPQR